MLWLFYLLDFFCSGIQFYLLLSPHLCFISLLYLYLQCICSMRWSIYLSLVTLDDALISKGSFMQTKYTRIYVSWSTSELRVRLAPWNRFKPSGKIVVLIVLRRYTSFLDHLCFSVLCLVCLCACLSICALWSPAGNGLISWISFVVSAVSLSLSHWYPGSAGRFLIFATLLTGHRPVNVKRAVIGSKGGWKLRTIFLSCKVFPDWSIIKLGNILYLLDRSIFAVLFETTSHCFCWLSLLVWLRKKDLAFWYFFQ